MKPDDPQPARPSVSSIPAAPATSAAGDVTAQTHVEHYFPKGYDPNAEPWKSIRQHVAELREQLEQATERYCKCVDEHADALIELSEARQQLATRDAALRQKDELAQRIADASVSVMEDRNHNAPAMKRLAKEILAIAPSGQTAGVASQKAGQP